MQSYNAENHTRTHYIYYVGIYKTEYTWIFIRFFIIFFFIYSAGKVEKKMQNRTVYERSGKRDLNSQDGFNGTFPLRADDKAPIYKILYDDDAAVVRVCTALQKKPE